MEAFETLTAHAAPMPEDNVDTDVIVPARFLLITHKKGLGRYAFYERRYNAASHPRLDFFLNDPRYADARILVAGANFGCGSSREQAPWALADLGFRAVVASSFGEIFASNCAKNRIVCAVVADTAPLLDDAYQGHSLTVDLINRVIWRRHGAAIEFLIDDGVREALLNGWDEIETILGPHGAAITDFETCQRNAAPWLWSNE